MTDNNALADDNIKGFGRYVFCDICAFDACHNEKLVFQYTAFRSEGEDGFAYKYTVNEFQNPDRIHIHRSSKQISGTSCQYRGNFEDAITFIDLLPELFPEIFKESRKSSIGTAKLQEFVN
jgi:hypothetical protein